jgi:hypothetical protein
MKKLFSFIVLATVALFSVESRAQSYNLSQATITSNSVVITAIEATITNTTVRATIPATRALNIAIQPTFVLAGAGTSAVVFKFDTSVDGSNWTSAAHSITVTANGTNTVSTTANVAVNAIGFLRLSSVENPNGTAINSLVIKYADKTP